MSLLFDFVLALGALIPRSILEIDCMGCFVAMVARSSYRIYPRGFDTSSVLRGAFVQRERRDRAWPE